MYTPSEYRKLEKLLDCTEEELFAYLPDRKQQELNREFVEECLDADDREEIILLVKDFNQPRVSDWMLSLDRIWTEFLKRKGLLSTYADAINEAYLCEHDADETDDAPPYDQARELRRMFKSA